MKLGSTTNSCRWHGPKGGRTEFAAGEMVLGAQLLADLNQGTGAEGEFIRIGSMLPLGAGATAEDIGGRHGLEMAVDEINAVGGVLGRPLQSVFVDTRAMNDDEVASAAVQLIERDGVHALICCDHRSNALVYEAAADAGIIYVRVNAAASSQHPVPSDPERYFGCFMVHEAGLWYDANLPLMLDQFRATGRWKPANNKIALVIGSIPYSRMVAQQIKEQAPKYGFEIAFEEVVPVPTVEWQPVLDRIRPIEPAVIANTHFFAHDLAHFQRQFVEKPSNSLIYIQHGALLQPYADITRQAGVGVLCSTMIGVPPEATDNTFAQRLRDRMGPHASHDPASFTYSEMYHYAIAAALAGGTGEPHNFTQNRKIAVNLKSFAYRSMNGTMRYHPMSRSMVPCLPTATDHSPRPLCQTYQIKAANGEKQLVFPVPHAEGSFELPSWFR
ncbi:ABC transporter substrate-binding protein [Geminicoccus harenae]|uniref:ABC transporter substrate-binding protein n=1 Tax=Geminicoccus harenae TaxID=2498453 RepID=UPI00168A4202|nr:ABC transporter substrate-binding protein [Geminicoccus harenae]